MIKGRAIAVRGVVQGVGFRPFVHELAGRLGLSGWVKNLGSEVRIEVEGDEAGLDEFVKELTRSAPPLARIASVECEERAALGARGFVIESSSAHEGGTVLLPPDVATCDDCLRELFDPGDRRYQYPFLNCTQCGPRLTIVRQAPYDRERTSMVGFPMCTECRAEYDDPSDRRFHAQPVACPACGPRLRLLDAGGAPIASEDLLGHVAGMIAAGSIVAVKGLGGYHLVCDAASAEAVERLRERKHRPSKAFAVAVAELEGARRLCELTAVEETALLSARRPIVLATRRPGAPVAAAVAPGSPYLGVMLPSTPLQHLLLRATGGGTLVMTSGNRADEPVAIDDAEALERLRGIADAFLANDRPILRRADDSVVRAVSETIVPIRRARGHAPEPVPLARPCPAPILAVGGQLKSVFALGQERNAFLSPHIGDLGGYVAWKSFTDTLVSWERLLAIEPGAVAHDLHPDYASTQYAVARARESGLPAIAVQHHHAHLASCLAENQAAGPAIGVVFDGAGLGPDGAVWGGEFLVGDLLSAERRAHLRYTPMPGGDGAVREPWRMAAAYLTEAQESLSELERRVGSGPVGTIRSMLTRRVNCPLTSSVGRLFDAISSLAGLGDAASFEGEAAMRLEWLATGLPADGLYPFELDAAGGALVADLRPAVRAIAADGRRGAAPAAIARRFHSTLVELVVAVCLRLRSEGAPAAVALTGGVFQNAILAAECRASLQDAGFRVYSHALVPPNDGGLCLGQLAIAAARLRAGVR
ncbi:MAG: carbamoyltransferase HypF [Candidatus Wallbacteria bacterium]|nr:carbamoyltransferase HypF [Candidatus Wallbacteria bacterium]